MNRRPMTREQAYEWRRRWQAVNDAEIEELRAMTVDEKVRQLAMLMASAEALGWTEKLREEDDQVRQRWVRLKQVARGTR